MYSVKESDWKLFRKLLPEWQERFIGRLLGEYSTMLAGQGLASDKFWRLQKRLQKDVRKVGVCAEMRRSVMDMNLRSLLLEGAISKDDLDGFSEELRQLLTIDFFFFFFGIVRAKLDPVDYSEKLTEILRENDIKSVTIVLMEVPCCGCLELIAKKALQSK